MKLFVLGLLLTAVLVSEGALVKNPSFESNYEETFPHYSAIDDWTGGRGVNEAAGPFHNGGTPIPDRARVAFSQGNTDLSQEITGLVPGRRYWIQFHYDARGCCGGTIDLITKFNAMELDRVTNVRPVTDGKPYNFRNVPFLAEGDSGTLMFTTIAQGDATVVLDAVTIVPGDTNQVPVMNPSFEASGDFPDSVVVSPASIAGWTGTGQYGTDISGTGSFANNGTAPEQDHVAFLQGAGSLGQTVPNLIAGRSYQLSVAYNARTGNTPHILVRAGDTVLFEENVTAVGGNNAYRTRTVSFVASDINAVITVAQTAEGDHTLLLDDVRIVGETQRILPLRFAPTVLELGPGQQESVAVIVPAELLANRAATLTFRSPNPGVARLPGADVDGVLSLTFDRGGTNTKSFAVEAVSRGVARIEVIDSSGLSLADDVTVNVVASLVRNASFESSGVPGGVGYGPILAWNGGSGLNAAAGPFHDNGIVPDRRQVAFLQGAQTLSQLIVGLSPGRSYWLQFFYNARAFGGTTIDLAVKFNGITRTNIAGITAVGDQTPYRFQNLVFIPSTSSGLLEFVTVPTGDATLLLDGVNIIARDGGEIVIRNPSFEASGSPSGVGYVQPDNLAGWEATGGGRGININGVGPFTDNGLSTDQDRAVFLQNTGTALSQNVSGFTVGQKYTLIYEVNTRNCCTPGPSSYSVTLADAILLEEELEPIGGTNAYPARYVVFTAVAPEGILRFEHRSDGDHSLLLDNVRIVPGEVGPPISAPTIAFARQSAGRIRLSWPVADAGFLLQSTAALPGGWAADNAPVTVEGDQNVATVNAAGTARWYRLIK